MTRSTFLLDVQSRAELLSVLYRLEPADLTVMLQRAGIVVLRACICYHAERLFCGPCKGSKVTL